MEDIGELLSRGFSVWKKNLNLCLPFLFSIILSMLMLIAFVTALFMVLMPAGFDALTFEDSQNATLMQAQMESLLSGLEAEKLASAALLFLVVMLLISLVNSFFSAGAIGMARQALETGRSDTAEMWSSGRKYFWNMFLATLLTGLITSAGLIALAPALALYPNPLAADARTAAAMVLGLILFLFYALGVSIILIAAPYALVVENLGPVSALRAAIKFFRYNKFDVFVMWLIITALSTGLQMIGGAAGEGAGHPLSMIASLANLMVLAPLSGLWWTRLYMNRAGMLKADEVKDPW